MATKGRNIVLLDGGMGQELIARSTRPPSPLWSARVLLEEPEIVEAVHLDYIHSGARVLTLNTYAATPERLARDGLEHEFEALQAAAIAVARSAISRAGPAGEGVRIAGCLSPLAGSYNPDQSPPDDIMRATYDRVVAVEADAVDVFLCETLASLREVEHATAAAAASGKPVWTGMTVSDRDGTKLRSGEPVVDGARVAVEAGAAAVLINCSQPEATSVALDGIGQISLPTGAYANGFTSIDALKIGGTVDVLSARTDLGPDAYAKHALRWIANGASIVGGCCEVGPEHIATLKSGIEAAGHRVSADPAPVVMPQTA